MKQLRTAVSIRIYGLQRANIFVTANLRQLHRVVNVMVGVMVSWMLLYHPALKCEPGNELGVKIIFRLQILFSHRMVSR